MTTPRRRWFPLDDEGERTPAPGHAAAVDAALRAPIDPAEGPKQALAGRIVTMDDGFNVVDDGVLYLERGGIVALRPRRSAPPAGFEDVRPVATGGTLFPGLIELHNHLSYNALPLWQVPRRFEHRGQWPDHPDYRRLISGPMTVVGAHRDDDDRAALLAPLVRYVECKALLGGTTTSQGIMLASNAGVQRYYRGLLRNVEQTDDPTLSEAQARIDDVDARDAKAFVARLNKEDSCFLLHLSEGLTADGAATSIARRHFLALQVAPDAWALNNRFTGIHAAGLLPEDFEVLGRHGGSMVWSPLSNLLLYGGTARVDAARRAGVRVALGSDWSPSGSKNLLGELKVAWLCAQHLFGGQFDARAIVAMATREAATVLRWQHALGSLAPGRRADLIVVAGRQGDPYEQLLHAGEGALRLVMVNGVPRVGTPALMAALGVGAGERWRVGRAERRLNLGQSTGDPDVAALSLAQARDALRRAFAQLPALARRLERPRRLRPMTAPLDAPPPVVWTLALDEIRPTGIERRPRLPYDGPGDTTGPDTMVLRAPAQPLSTLLQPFAPDALTVADDPGWLARIAAQPNLPPAVRDGLAALY